MLAWVRPVLDAECAAGKEHVPEVWISASFSGALVQSCPRLSGGWGCERQPRRLDRSHQALSPVSDREQLPVSEERI